VSSRHLSFVETGRAVPSRDVVLRLADSLEIPVRERNALLVAAGYAPVFQERSLDDPSLAPVRAAVELILERQKPYPAFAIDRHWNIVASNGALQEMYDGVAEALLKPPVNALRLSLHPRGIAPRIENLGEWRTHLLGRLDQQCDATADGSLMSLRNELRGYPGPPAAHGHDAGVVIVPLRLRLRPGLFSFFSATMVFGGTLDVTLSELAVECFFPADAATSELVDRVVA